VNDLTPRKAIFDALQRCSSGLTLRGLAQVAYGGSGSVEMEAAYQIVYRLRDHARIEISGSHHEPLYRLLGVTV
jgi:hypothetical protein